MASWFGHEEVVRTLLEYGADVNAKNEVRNQMMMMLIIVITIMIMMMVMIMAVIYEED